MTTTKPLAPGASTLEVTVNGAFAGHVLGDDTHATAWMPHPTIPDETSNRSYRFPNLTTALDAMTSNAQFGYWTGEVR